MKKLFILMVVALIFSLLSAGTGKKTIYTQLDIVEFNPDSLVINRADLTVWGTFTIISPCSLDTASLTSTQFVTESLTVTQFVAESLTATFVVADTIKFVNGAIIVNPHTDTVTITEAVIILIGDALLDDVTIDSAVTVVGKAVFNDTVMLGDSADKMILPKGSAIELYDTTDTDKFQIYDDGTHSCFASANPFIIDNNFWIPGDTLFFTDGGADTCFIINDGNFLILDGDIHTKIEKTLYLSGHMVGSDDAGQFQWQGYQWHLDYDNDAALAFISFHAEDSIIVDTTGATGHIFRWTGYGGFQTEDATGADTSRWYDDGTNVKFDGDNPFIIGNALSVTGGLSCAAHFDGSTEARSIRWDGNQCYIDYNNDNPFAYLYFHGESEAFKADSAGQKLWWTGAGGIGITDAVGGADSARWYDDGSSTIFITDNDFVLSDDVTLGDTINTVFLPRGTRLVFADSSGADSTTFHNDGTKLSITSDNKIELGGNNIYLGADDTLYFISATPDTFFITNQGGQARIMKPTGNLSIDASIVLSGSLQVFGNATLFDTYCREWRIDANADDSLALITWHNIDSLMADTISSQLEWTGVGGFKADNIVSVVCDTVASAATITLGNYNNFVISGTAAIDSIDTAGAIQNWGIAYIEFTGTAALLGFTDGKNLKLNTNFAYSPDDILVLQRRGDIFYEISRSGN